MHDTYMVLHNPCIGVTDFSREERRHTVRHLIQHRAQAPPVRLPTVRSQFVLFAVIVHLQGDQGFFMCLKDLGRYIIACATRNLTMLVGHNLTAIMSSGKQWSSRSEVNQADMSSASNDEVVRFNIAAKCMRS